MLALVTIFLVTFLIAFVVVRSYRAFAGWQGFGQPVAKQQSKPSRTSLKAQFGFISLISESKKKAKVVKLRGPKDGIRAPWGW